MELIVRIYSHDGHSADVVVGAEATHSVGELAVALARELRLADPHPAITLLRTGTVLEPDVYVAHSGILSGDDLVVGAPHEVSRVPAIPVRGSPSTCSPDPTPAPA